MLDRNYGFQKKLDTPEALATGDLPTEGYGVFCVDTRNWPEPDQVELVGIYEGEEAQTNANSRAGELSEEAPELETISGSDEVVGVYYQVHEVAMQSHEVAQNAIYRIKER